MREHLEAIFAAGLDRVNPYKMITRHVNVQNGQLIVAMENYERSVNLDDYNRILVLGAGKASAPMAKAFEEILGDRIEKGLVCVKYGHTEPLERVEVVEAGHPIPDENGVHAAKRIADLASEADAETLVINCISGGGSALLPSPMDERVSGGLASLSLVDKQRVTEALLRCGADITEINCVRKHISGMKGGRLLQLMHPARSLNFILSDVIGDDLGSIASGVTSHDETTFSDALAIIDRYELRGDIPANVLTILELGAQGRIPETPGAGDPALATADNILIGTNRQALLAAAARARELGYQVQALTAQLGGEARHVAKVLADIAKDATSCDMFLKKPVCLITGGESVVTLQGNGRGGRNQEMALAFLHELSRWRHGRDQVHFLAASTDGNDGPTDAAGAFADERALLSYHELQGETIHESLKNNDSYNFFERIGALFKTGPTNTNVCDLQMVLIV
ncbi:glycerate kinase type-2 family protein [Salidesulfovibrio onnuriiensis]|uniref:glycerate kinase type-2 family protein n=1 Tax=Salidesulfovibrio onnuriiensis TaxID=2583823 RepID=UPI0011C7A5D7|nr:glycerate kinase [Salidesulfovibrio onnuriiensis]